MQYAASLPATALVAIALIQTGIYVGLLPPGMQVLEYIQAAIDDYFFLATLIIILLEAIIYVGFYFPGQFFAVLLVVLSEPDYKEISLLTLAMVMAATIGSAINLSLGRYLSASRKDPADDPTPTSTGRLMLAMIHINALAFFMFNRGSQGGSYWVVFLAGLLNLPYYLLLIVGTVWLSEDIMQMAENTQLLFTLICIWLAIALGYDIRRCKNDARAK